ncbi:AMP-binding protein [Pseudomonas sp.]|uniref:AMP-binding protein n=1 Tax=Pseudomonas sp. TaxID=306 RepID=UPI003D0D4DEB
MQLITYFEQAVRRFPDRIAFVQPDGTEIDYGRANRILVAIAGCLSNAGLAPDAKVAVFSPNDAAGFLAMLGAIRAGLAWVSLNPRNTIEDNIALADMAEARALFFHSKFEAQAELIVSRLPGIELCVCIDKPSPLGRSLAEIEAEAPRSLPDLDEDNERPCTVFATGGTTGRSKGAVWTNQTWETLIANFWTCAPRSEHPVHLCVAPMTHGAGALALMLLPKAPTNVLMTSADPVAILQTIERYRVTHMFLPPTVLYALLSSPHLADYNTSSLAFFLISAAPVAPDKLREAVGAFGPIMCQSFGQAEAPFFLTYLSPEDHVRALSSPEHARLLQSCGRATMFSEVEIMDEDGHILPIGETGEIVARGNLRMAGYYKDPAATAAVSEHGWHHTGDIGRKDAEGYVYIVDRKRDMIITGGFNVFSTEVESALLSHPAILDCAVVGVPDDKWGEAVRAVVELKKGLTVNTEELVDHCKQALGSVKAPKAVEIWETLPRSPVGKVLKRTIRDRFWAGRERSV